MVRSLADRTFQLREGRPLVAATGSHGRFLERVRERAVDAAGAPARFLEVAAEAPLGRGLCFLSLFF